MPRGWSDDHVVAGLLGADFRVWDDEAVDWSAYDRVVLRSVWDYSDRSEEFLAWCRAVGSGRLRNLPELVAFNLDKRYLSQLSTASVPTMFIAPGDDIPAFDGEIVVKPNISAGARNTGRFGPRAHAAALSLIERIHASGRVALVQPYLPAIDQRGETALVYIGGELSHVLTKRAVLRGDGVAPVADGELGVAAAMLEDDLVRAGTADGAQRALATEVHAEICDRFGVPVYARVDLVEDPDGAPVLLELETIEPSLYLATSPGASERLAAAVRAC
ncbi:MAG: ATP-grasp domain-containing protein [Solirubrobacteraceae bacterium]